MAPQTHGAWAAGLSQDDLMIKDKILVLDTKDNVIGSASKKDSHVFSADQPHGILHRAFSVFLIDASDGRLLLQQRAASKITFPSVWTNTCCSHPLHGMTPNEVDTPQDVRDGTVHGVKHAAIRKLQHELGIGADVLSVDDFTFVTRLHYWAADTITHGPKAPWGEHEIDYILFCSVPHKRTVDIYPHADEVDDVKWVNADELRVMLKDDTLLFSPWFRLIVDRWLYKWWKEYPEQISAHYDFHTIHEFDPPPEHFGGAGKAQALFLKGDEGKKQGAYGKIAIHKESKLSQLARLDEVWSALTILYIRPLQSNINTEYIRKEFPVNDLAFCDDILQKVSRSFAAVIRQLPSILLVDILIFYLVLRALDTIEDDTTAFESQKVKIEHLRQFDKRALQDPDWRMDNVGAGDEKRLLQEFPKCHAVYQRLSPESRRIIADITQRMAGGMAEFVSKDLGQGTGDVEQYNRYCHFVAGLVGEGLSRLFAASGLERASFAGELHLSDQMGLFLQKTNIIRDYLEDYVDKRAFWPQTIWKKYSESGDLGYFTDQDDATVQEKSLHCLNELVSDALELAPDCLAYMSKLQCVEIFRFCAIPQVMAIATLDKCYANGKVFTGVVKIRKGLSCKLLLRTNNLCELHDTFYIFARSIMQHAMTNRQHGVQDPSYDRTMKACQTILDLTADRAYEQRKARWMRQAACLSLLSAVPLLNFVPAAGDRLDRKWLSPARALLMGGAGLIYMFGPWSVSSELKRADKLDRRSNGAS